MRPELTPLGPPSPQRSGKSRGAGWQLRWGVPGGGLSGTVRGPAGPSCSRGHNNGQGSGRQGLRLSQRWRRRFLGAWMQG